MGRKISLLEGTVSVTGPFLLHSLGSEDRREFRRVEATKQAISMGLAYLLAMPNLSRKVL